MTNTIRFRLPGSALAFALGCVSASTVGEHHTLGLVLAVTAVVTAVALVADMSIGFQRGKRL